MREEPVRIFGFIAFGLVIALGILAFIQMLSVSPLWGESGAAWVQAIGSLGAIGGAVWIFQADRASKKADAEAIANLAAAKFGLQAFHVAAVLRSVLETVDSAQISDLGIEFLSDIQKTLSALPDWPMADLATLAPLPDKVAFNMGNAIGRLNFAKAHLSTIISGTGGLYDGKFVASILEDAEHWFNESAMSMQFVTVKNVGTYKLKGRFNS